MKNRNHSVAAIFIIVFVVIALSLCLILNLLSGRIPSNPPGTIGNTAGNINNSGLFCERGGTVYFANSYDNNSIYSMQPGESNLQKINDVTCCNILAGGNYLYYFRYGTSTDGGLGSVRAVKSFNRSNLNGENVVSLTRDVVTKAQLVDNHIYALIAGKEHPEFYKFKIDNSEKLLLAEYEINPACAENGTIYYNGTQQEHYLYGLDTASDTPYEIWKGNLWLPDKQGDYIYFLDVPNNYRLCRYSMNNDVIEALTNERIDCYNVNNDYIYYQTNGSSPALKCMRTDGTGLQTIAEGIYTNINMTSQYVYFQEYGDEITTYHSQLGSNVYEEFGAAKAVLMNK